jgi:hypothetical protein
MNCPHPQLQSATSVTIVRFSHVKNADTRTETLIVGADAHLRGCKPESTSAGNSRRTGGRAEIAELTPRVKASLQAGRNECRAGGVTRSREQAIHINASDLPHIWGDQVDDARGKRDAYQGRVLGRSTLRHPRPLSQRCRATHETDGGGLSSRTPNGIEGTTMSKSKNTELIRLKCPARN